MRAFWLRLLSLFLVIDASCGRDTTGIRVVGAGFGRTGTTSLDFALQEFGYRVYHGSTFYERVSDWKLFEEALARNGTRGEQSALWDKLVADGFDAILDDPASVLWRSQLRHSPAAKVILSVRDPSAWAESMLMVRNDNFAPVHGWWKRRPFQWFSPFSSLRSVMKIIHHDSCGQFPCAREGNVHQINKSISLFQARSAAVQETVPSEQLLIWNPSEGWEPLCKFLQVERCPSDKPFPVTNRREQWRALAEARGKAGTSPVATAFEYLWLPVCLLVLVFVRFRILGPLYRRALSSFTKKNS